jgi:hypothetical protein
MINLRGEIKRNIRRLCEKKEKIKNDPAYREEEIKKNQIQDAVSEVASLLNAFAAWI